MRGRKIYGIVAVRWRTQWAETKIYVVHEPLFCFMHWYHTMATTTTMWLGQQHMVSTSPYFIPYCFAQWQQRKVPYRVQAHRVTQWRQLIISCRAMATTTKPVTTTKTKKIHCARAHYMLCCVRVTTSYHSNTGKDDDDTNVDEQAVDATY
jgi:hypothetical protein